jgi:hypothetical protein
MLRYCLLNYGIEEKFERNRRRRRRRKQPLDDLEKMRIYLKLKEEALDRTVCITRFGRAYGPVIRQITS